MVFSIQLKFVKLAIYFEIIGYKNKTGLRDNNSVLRTLSSFLFKAPITYLNGHEEYFCRDCQHIVVIGVIGELYYEHKIEFI